MPCVATAFVDAKTVHKGSALALRFHCLRVPSPCGPPEGLQQNDRTLADGCSRAVAVCVGRVEGRGLGHLSLVAEANDIESIVER